MHACTHAICTGRSQAKSTAPTNSQPVRSETSLRTPALLEQIQHCVLELLLPPDSVPEAGLQVCAPRAIEHSQSAAETS